jgi:hypothetical protein
MVIDLNSNSEMLHNLTVVTAECCVVLRCTDAVLQDQANEINDHITVMKVVSTLAHKLYLHMRMHIAAPVTHFTR